MSEYRSVSKAYRHNSVTTARPAIQVAMLLEQAAVHMNQARVHMEEKDYEARYNETEKAVTIISGLQQCLAVDEPSAQHMVEVFDNYYTHMTLLITHVNVRNDVKACDVVVHGLKELASAWREVDSQNINGSLSDSPNHVVASSQHASGDTPTRVNTSAPLANSSQTSVQGAPQSTDLKPQQRITVSA